VLAYFVIARQSKAAMTRHTKRENIMTPQELYLDYFNNFISVKGFADYYAMTEKEAQETIDNGRALHEAQFSKELILKEASGAFNRPYKLAKVSAGYESAGSARRYTKGGFRVISYDMSGTRHSKMFNNYDDALADFEQWTTPIVEIKS
jgi:hypothetical protein